MREKKRKKDPPVLFRVNNEGVWIRGENRLAAAAAIIVPDRCHHWQRPLPIMGAVAANPKGMVFSPDTHTDYLRGNGFLLAIASLCLRRNANGRE
jgi:hypothetical protein